MARATATNGHTREESEGVKWQLLEHKKGGGGHKVVPTPQIMQSKNKKKNESNKMFSILFIQGAQNLACEPFFKMTKLK